MINKTKTFFNTPIPKQEDYKAEIVSLAQISCHGKVLGEQ